MPLVVQNIESNRGDGHVYAETARLAEGPISREEFLSMAAAVSDHLLTGESRACVAYGYGSRPRALYQQLRHDPDVSLLWDATISPWWMKPLALLAAAHGGLVQIRSPRRVTTLMDELSELAMTELYSFPRTVLKNVRSYVEQNTWRSFPGEVVGQDSAYFCLGVDGDSRDAPDTGHFAWVSYGSECPESLVRAIEPWCVTRAA